MALTYRTPMEDIVAYFDPTVQASISGKAAKTYKQLEEYNFDIANYYINAFGKKKLSTAGIYLSPFSAVVHSHPICKTLENYMLYTVLPSYINNKFFFVGIKSGKLQLLKQRDPNLTMLKAINRFVTSRDKLRYGNEFVIRASAPHKALCRQAPCLADVTLRDIVPELVTRGSKYLFLHDELHYWRKKDLATFLEVLKPEVVIGTLVFPPEVLIGAAKSLNPWCYEFEIVNGNILFYPDGVRSEGYEQPVHGGFLLKANSFKLPNGDIYRVDVLCSKYAHHLVSLTRGDSCVPKYRSFDKFEAVGFESLKDLTASRLPYLPVCFEVVSKLYRYLRSLKKPDLQSAMAKLSQIVEEPNADEIKFAQEFAELVINNGSVRSLICPNRWKSFLCKFYKKALPAWLAERFKTVREVSLDSFICALKPLCFTIKLEEISASMLEDFFVWDGIELENEFDVFHGLDGFYGQSLSGIPTHSEHSTPYSALAPISDSNVRKVLIELDSEHFAKQLARIFIRSQEVKNRACITEANILLFLQAVLTRGGPVHISSVSLHFGSIEQLTQRVHKIVLSLSARLLRDSFIHCGKAWFNSGRRDYTLYLSDKPETVNFFSDFKSTWLNVVHEVSLATTGRARRWTESGRSAPIIPLVERATALECPQVCTESNAYDFFGITKAAQVEHGFDFYIDPKIHNKPVVIVRDRAFGVELATKFNFSGYEWPEWLDVWLELQNLDATFEVCVIQTCFTRSCTGCTHAPCFGSPFPQERVLYFLKDGVHISSVGDALRCSIPEDHFLHLGSDDPPVEGLHVQHKHTLTIIAFYHCFQINPPRREPTHVEHLQTNHREIVPAESHEVATTTSMIVEHTENTSFEEFVELCRKACTDKLHGRSGGFFSDHSDSYSYNGGHHVAKRIPCWLAAKRTELGLGKEFDHILIQQYSKGARIGFHADDESCYTPEVEVLTLNVTGEAIFKLTKPINGVIELLLKDGDVFIMPSGYQKTGKHSVEVLTEGRISITFRNCTLDYKTRSAAHLQGSNNAPVASASIESSTFANSSQHGVFLRSFQLEKRCFEVIHTYPNLELALANEFSLNPCAVAQNCMEHLARDVDELIGQNVGGTALGHYELGILRQTLSFCAWSGYTVCLDFPNASCACVVGREDNADPENCCAFISLCTEQGLATFKAIVPKNLCVIKAIAEALHRPIKDLFAVLQREEHLWLFKRIFEGRGVDLYTIERLAVIFSIHASIEKDGGHFTFNDNGATPAHFLLSENHLSFFGRNKQKGFELQRTVDLDKRFTQEVCTFLATHGTHVDFSVNFNRAELLADSFCDGSTGVVLSELFNDEPNMKVLFSSRKGNELVVRVLLILGTFGAGKSRIFTQIGEKAKGRKFTYVSPRKALVQDLKAKMGYTHKSRDRKIQGQENWGFHTFEKFLKQAPFLCTGELVFIDEIQLYPPGYLDLVFALATEGVQFILLGDPCQSDYDNEKDRIMLDGVLSNIDALLGNQEYRFNVVSNRFLNANFVNRLPCKFNDSLFSLNEPYVLREGLDNLKDVPEKFREVFLVSSFDEKKVVTSYVGHNARVLTFGESTGLTFSYGTIVITLISSKAGEKRWITALSRFRKNVALINCTGYATDGLLVTYRERALGRFLTGQANHEQLLEILPGKPQFTEGFTDFIGADEGVREAKLIGDPWLKSMIELLQIEDVQEEEIQEFEMAVEEFKVHLPREELEGTRARWVHRILAKEFREVRIGSLVSNQFTDDHSNQRGAVQLTNAAERFEAIYPRHRANDTVTFLMAVKKRLRFSKPHIEKAKLMRAKPFGKFLLDEFLAKVPLKPHHDKYKMEKARQDFFDKKTSKSAATIENHHIRSCREWLCDIAQIFSKSQLCTKYDNRFRSAKAAQSIVCFQHSVLCRLAPYMRYIEMKLHEALPKRFYIHSGKGLEELNDWVKANDFSGECTESDYEAFDSSQDHFIMAFELELMKYLRLPHDLIADYEYIKTHLGSKLGSFAIMRFSGEASTFLFNTMANMLFTFLRYNLSGNESICFAGDDMCASRALKKKNQHEVFLSKLTLKAKVQYTKNPTFCGWHLCPDGIYKKPQLVFERMCIAKETNNLANCIDNYAIEVSYAYRLGERITARMDEEELGAYYGCVRTIIRNKHLLKSDVKELFTLEEGSF